MILYRCNSAGHIPNMFALHLILLLIGWIAAIRVSGIAHALGETGCAYLLLTGTIAPLLLPKLGFARSMPILRPADTNRIKLKSLALSLGLALMLAHAQLMQHFAPDAFARFAQHGVILIGLSLACVPFYVRWVDRRMATPEDEYLNLGEALTGKRAWSWPEQQTFVLSWVIKIAFTPIMAGGLIGVARDLAIADFPLTAPGVIEALFVFGLGADLTIACIGYACSSKLLGNEIKSVEPTWGGWFACMICYPPYNWLMHQATHQQDKIVWSDWLQMSDWLYWPWAFAIAATWIIYWLATASFGTTFSNLTWRKLVDSGPYRYTKHPAYISKNAYWWLSTVPFVGVSSTKDLLRNIAGMTLLSLIYYLRAKTEERHLMRFPEYAAYAAHIDEQGLLAKLRRLLRT